MDQNTVPAETTEPAAPAVKTVAEFNPWAMRKKTVKPLYKEFTDAESGMKLGMRLQPIGALETCAALQEAAKLAEEVGLAMGDGEAEEELDGQMQGVDGEAYQLNFLLIKDICFLRAMQPDNERRDFLWWLGVATHADDLYTQISNWAATLKRRSKPAGNPKGTSRTTKR